MLRARNRAVGAVAAPVRLRRLRLRLTLLFTGAYAIGLVVLAVLVIEGDVRFGHSRLDADLRQRARDATPLVSFDSQGRIDVSPLVDGGYADGYPWMFVYAKTAPSASGPAFRRVLRSSAPLAPSGDYSAVARDALAERGEATATRSHKGASLRMLAEPFFDPKGHADGAVVAVADTRSIDADHRRLTILVWSGCGGLLITAAIAGYLLASRSTRPVGDALAQQERFLADAAHELRSPVASLRAVTEGGMAGDEEPRRALERASGIVGEASETLDDLLTLARMDARREPVTIERVRLDLLVEELLSSRDYQPPITLDAQAAVVEADPQLLRRAIGNLIENAVRHGRAADANAEIRVTVRPGRVEVADRGPGIERDLLPELFERFRSGRRSAGSGLGLAIVEWVARAHRGKVTAANRPDGGAVFTLIMPA